MPEMLPITPLTYQACLTAALCGLIIGFERQWSGKPAGIRTSILICLSAYTFVAIAKFYQPETGSVRIVGQIITGVGFLGAGVIIAREGLVLGVTSAAVIWILAGIGSLIGLDHYGAAIWLALLTVAVLIIINFLERVVKKLNTGVHKQQRFGNGSKREKEM